MRYESYSAFENSRIVELYELGISSELIRRMLRTGRSAAAISQQAHKLGAKRPRINSGRIVHVQMNDALYQAIGKESKRIGTTKSQFTRMALIAYLSELGHR